VKDDELRAFLESATVSDDEESQPESPVEPLDLPSAPEAQASAAAPPADARGLSFDELIQRGMSGQNSADPQDQRDPQPIVLPGPSEAPGGRDRQPSSTGGIQPTVPIVIPVAPPAAAPTVSPTAPPATAAEPPAVPRAVAPTVPAAPAAPVAMQLPPVPAAAAQDDFPPTQPMIAPGLSADAYEPISVTGGERGGRRVLPWLIVTGGVVVALLAAFFVVSSLTGGDKPQNGADSSATTDGSTQTEGDKNSTTDANQGGSSPSKTTTPTTPSKTTPPASKVPAVEVGPTMNMPIPFWSTQVDLSQKLGNVSFQITGDKLVLTSSLISSLPASCAGDWGMTKVANGFEVLKPAAACTAAPELYDELWGLMDAMVKTARPL